MEIVVLEWIGSVEVEPQDVVQFVQRLNNVPEDAVCEIGDIFSQRHRSSQRPGKQQERTIRNEIHLSCEPRVAEFLCNKFGKQTQHVTGGEVIQVRCKHVYPGAKPLGIRTTTQVMNPASECVDEGDETIFESEPEAVSSNLAATVLPIDKVIALIDLLGDQVVDAQEAYELFADRDVLVPQRMTLLGFTKALSKLCKNELSAKPPRVRGNSSRLGDGGAKITVESLRSLLSRLIASNNVAVKRIPTSTTAPFLSYTDFLATYVAFLADLYSTA